MSDRNGSSRAGPSIPRMEDLRKSDLLLQRLLSILQHLIYTLGLLFATRRWIDIRVFSAGRLENRFTDWRWLRIFGLRERLTSRIASREAKSDHGGDGPALSGVRSVKALRNSGAGFPHSRKQPIEFAI